MEIGITKIKVAEKKIKQRYNKNQGRLETIEDRYEKINVVKKKLNKGITKSRLFRKQLKIGMAKIEIV